MNGLLAAYALVTVLIWGWLARSTYKDYADRPVQMSEWEMQLKAILCGFTLALIWPFWVSTSVLFHGIGKKEALREEERLTPPAPPDYGQTPPRSPIASLGPSPVAVNQHYQRDLQ